MPDGRYIAERDWPVVWDLIKARRGGSLNRSLGRPQRTPERPADRRVVLLEPVFSYQTVWAVWTQREEGLKSVDLRTLGFNAGGEFVLRITAPPANDPTVAVTLQPIPHNATARELRQKISVAETEDGDRPFNFEDLTVGIGGQPDPDDENITFNPGRWIIEFGGKWAGKEITVVPIETAFNHPFDASVGQISTGLAGVAVEMQAIIHDWYDPGHRPTNLLEVTLDKPIEDPNPLRAGSVCNVNWIDGNWIIYTAEPRKYIDETITLEEPYVFS